MASGSQSPITNWAPGLKYFQCGGNCSALRAPSSFPVPCSFHGPMFNSGLSNYQWSTECIKHDFMLFFSNFAKFRKSIQHCEFMIVKMWNLNDSLTIGLLWRRLLTCWTQERRFRLWNPIILQPERPRLKFPGPGLTYLLFWNGSSSGGSREIKEGTMFCPSDFLCHLS